MKPEGTFFFVLLRFSDFESASFKEKLSSECAKFHSDPSDSQIFSHFSGAQTALVQHERHECLISHRTERLSHATVQ